MRLKKKKQNNLLICALILFFIVSPLYAADDEFISYLNEIGQITTEVQIIIRNVGMNPQMLDSGISQLDTDIQKFNNLKPPKELERYHKLMLSGLRRFKNALGAVSKKDAKSSRREAKRGALLFKKAAAGFRKIAQDKGLIQMKP